MPRYSVTTIPSKKSSTRRRRVITRITPLTPQPRRIILPKGLYNYNPAANVARNRATSTNAQSVPSSSGVLNLPVQRKKPATAPTTVASLVRDVDKLKKAQSDVEQKHFDTTHSCELYLLRGFVASTNPSATPSNVVWFPMPSNVSHILNTGVSPENRIGAKVFFKGARIRVRIILTQHLLNLISASFASDVGVSGAKYTITEHQIAMGAVGAGTIANVSNLAGAIQASDIVQAKVFPYESLNTSFSIPVRVVVLSVKQSFVKLHTDASDIRTLVPSDIFAAFNDSEGEALYSNTRDFFYSRKIRNTAAGQVSIKSDTVYTLSTHGSKSTYVILDKYFPINQEYDFSAGKDEQWIQSVMIFVPNQFATSLYACPRIGNTALGTIIDGVSAGIPLATVGGYVNYYYTDQ